MTITYYCTRKLNFYKAKILLRLLLWSFYAIEISKASTYTEACICKAISYSETRDHEFNFVV